MYCKNCGSEVNISAKFCKNCGKEILRNPIIPTETGSTQKPVSLLKDNKKPILIALGVIVVLLIIILIVSNSGSSTTDSQVNIQSNSNTIPISKAVDSSAPNYNQDKIVSSVVNILCSDGNNSSGGSGTIVDSSGLVITNNHIIPEDNTGNPKASYCLVTLPDSQGKVKEIYYGKPVVIPDLSQTYDLAFISIDSVYVDDKGVSYGTYPNTFPSFLPNGCTNDNVTLGEKVRVFGYPAISGGGYYLTITDGIVSSLPNDGTIVTSAKVAHGDSGGLAVDENGCMIGIPSMVSRDTSESLGIIISYSVISDFINRADNIINKN